MHTTRNFARGLLVGALALATLPVATEGASAGAAGCVPRVLDLGTLGGSDSEIDGSNGLGDWVGSATDAAGNARATLWHDGVVRDLGENDAWAADVNDHGVVVGNADIDSAQHAFTWYRGAARDLPTPGGTAWSYVRRVNDRDDAAGIIAGADGLARPALWTGLRTARLLPVPTGFDEGEGLGINADGDVVGDVWNDTTFQDLAWEWSASGASHALGPDYRTGFSEANVVNDRGWAAGGLDFGGQLGLWSAVWRKGPAEKLGQLGADLNFSFAFGQDQIGDYVGGATYTIDDPFLHAFVTHVGTGRLLALMPLSGNPDDRSNAHAAVPPTPASRGLSVGGESTTSAGEFHATVWTCATSRRSSPPQGA